MKQAADAIRHSDEIRCELEAVMKRIDETGYAQGSRYRDDATFESETLLDKFAGTSN